MTTTIRATVYGWATDRDTGHTYRFTRHFDSSVKMDCDIALSLQEELETQDPLTAFEVEGWHSKDLTP